MIAWGTSWVYQGKHLDNVLLLTTIEVKKVIEKEYFQTTYILFPKDILFGACSLVVSNLCPETKSSWLSPTASYVQRWALCSNHWTNVKVSVEQVEVVETNYSDSLPLPLLSCESWMFMKENPGRKIKIKTFPLDASQKLFL